MNRVIILAATLFALTTIQGCATHERQDKLASHENDTISCREIDLELAKTRAYVDRVIDHVNAESKFRGRDVLASLGGFGIGNATEKSATLENAGKRIEQLGDLRDTKKCGADSA